LTICCKGRKKKPVPPKCFLNRRQVRGRNCSSPLTGTTGLEYTTHAQIQKTRGESRQSKKKRSKIEPQRKNKKFELSRDIKRNFKSLRGPKKTAE